MTWRNRELRFEKNYKITQEQSGDNVFGILRTLCIEDNGGGGFAVKCSSSRVVYASDGTRTITSTSLLPLTKEIIAGFKGDLEEKLGQNQPKDELLFFGNRK